MTPTTDIRIGCAGWSIPKPHAAHFPPDGSHLERYARRFGAVEINSSFYNPHRPTTYARWAETVPAAFQFAVKVPRTITHTRRLAGVETELESFLAEVTSLGTKLGPLLVQLPPGLAFDHTVADRFFSTLRERFDGDVVCEPRHATWFSPEADALLAAWQVARVAADPALMPEAAQPGGWDGIVYYRLHGSPRIYYSTYDTNYLDVLARTLAQHAARRVPAWCIFDNTAESAATANALYLLNHLAQA